MRNRTFASFFLVLLVVSAGCAKTTPPRAETSPGKPVEIAMRGSHFDPASVTVSRGQVVTLRFTNHDKIAHEAFVGDETEQKAHEAEMRVSRKDGHAMQTMQDGITVLPGKTGSLTHVFNTAGRTLVGCHEPGHYAAGMVIHVTVR
jgi:uncharacterized cupredoxin-like copper-binding protein